MMGLAILQHWGRHVLSALVCLAVLFWSLSATSDHSPKIMDTLQDHAQMIAEHGHSHGFEEDLRWAMHGHSHDGADHDHSNAALLAQRTTNAFFLTPARWAGFATSHRSPPVFRLDRPPRA
jgi:hypothetical protein